MSLSWRIGLPVVFTALGGVVAYLAFYWFLGSTATDARFMEVAGSLAVRSEQIGRLAYSLIEGFEWTRDPLRESVQRFDEDLRNLQEGTQDDGQRLDPAPPEMYPSLARVRDVWANAQELALRVAQLPSDDPAAEQSYLELRPLLPELTESAETLVQTYSERTERLRMRMHLALAVICLLDLTLMVLGWVLIRRYVIGPVRNVESAARQIQQGDLTARISVHSQDEIASLSNSFNAMADSVSELLRARERMYARLRELSRRLLHAQEAERRRIARELHDSTLQSLMAVSLNLNELEPHIAPLPDRPNAIVRDTQGVVANATKELRNLSYLLHPPLLDEVGLEAALREYVQGLSRRSDLVIHMELPDEYEKRPYDVELVLFRIVQECLTNIVRHSGSRKAKISLGEIENHLELCVTDWGKGMDADTLEATDNRSARYGVGITGMRERVEQVGGRLEITSGSEGTIITAIIPDSPDSPADEDR